MYSEYKEPQVMSANPSSDSNGTEDVGPFRSVQLSSTFGHYSDKQIMMNNSPMTSPTSSRRKDFMTEQMFQQQIMQLKKQQHMQQQILLQHFQAQRLQLAQHHEQQLRQHFKDLWERHKEIEEREQRERTEQERLELLRKKEKHEESAVASSEVKQKLQGFLLSKKHREAASSASNPCVSQYRNWNVLQSEPNVASGTPYSINSLLGKYEDDFPLRKTASESSLLRLRLKQRVQERRVAPIARPNRKILQYPNNNSESGQSPPPMNLISNARGSPSAGRNTPIQEEVEPDYDESGNSDSNTSATDLSLYSSPSLPNISLGIPPLSNNMKKFTPATEAEMRAAFTARLGMPLTGQLLPTTLPYFPSLPVPEFSSTSPVYVHKQMQALEQSRLPFYPSSFQNHSSPITDSQVAHARLNKQGQRPLGRTQSAPLPLGHPMLTANSAGNLLVHYEEEQEQNLQHMQHNNYLKQQIRETVLTRVNSRSQINNIATTQVCKDDDTSEVMDLTSKQKNVDKHNNDSQLQNMNQMSQQLNEKQIRDVIIQNSLQATEEINAGLGQHMLRPLARAFSSPLVAINTEPSTGLASSSHYLPKFTGGPHTVTTALAFDSLMLKHACVCGDNSSHAEHGGRLQSVWARLMETGLVQRCDRVRSRKATLEELQTCHNEGHTLLFGSNPINRQKIDVGKLAELPIKSFVRLPCGGVGIDSDTVWNDLHTAPAARMAVGCVIDLAFKAACGDIKNGFAIVRPPGHHAETSQAMGFCIFNSVAVAAKLLQQRLDLKRILIVDWDVHHGNGTQQIFYEDRKVLYISIHRHDDGNFFPGTGSPHECGGSNALGYNINIAWQGGLNPPMADAEYLAAFRTIVMPIAREFMPDIVLISAGFDAANGHPPPLGGYKVSPACFGFMTQQLSQLANGKVVLALEGGYDLPAICDCSEECVRTLLDGNSSPISDEELRRVPCQNAIESLKKSITIQAVHWPLLKRYLHTLSSSAVEATICEENETVTAMASLSVNKRNSAHVTNSVEPMDQDEVK